MITSQNVLPEAQVIFLFHKKIMFHCQDIQVFVFLLTWPTDIYKQEQ